MLRATASAFSRAQRAYAWLMEQLLDLLDSEVAALEHALTTADRRSYLDAVDGQRRCLRLKLVSDDLLRKPSTAVQARRMRTLADDLAEQACDQMHSRGRRPFRGEVAVGIDLHAIGVQQPAASPPAVKAYLDLLQGIAYRDDGCIACLRVTRHAKDNPLFRGVPEDWVYSGAKPRFPHGPKSHVEVRITIQPLRTYVADVDRLFRLREKVFEDRYGDDLDADGAEFFGSRFDHFEDDGRLDELREEERDEAERRGLYAAGGLFEAHPELAANVSRMRKAELRALRRKLLLDNGPGPLDRPGPPPAVTRLLWHSNPSLKRLDSDDTFGPGRFLLPEVAGVPGAIPWRQHVRREMTDIHGRWRILDVLIGAPLALDIAVREPAAGKDLDNLARDVVVPFEEVFCANERGTVASYRVYRAVPQSGVPGVRLLVTGDERLDSFERAVTTARQWLLMRGPRYADDD